MKGRGEERKQWNRKRERRVGKTKGGIKVRISARELTSLHLT